MTDAHATWPEPTTVRVGDTEDGPIDLAVHELGPKDGTAVVFCHGFPELAYSWRHQLPAVADAGFRAIAPDMRGYGGSSKPERIEAYDMAHLCGDLVGLLDALEIQKAVFAGHDWGGFVVWAMPILHPDRCAGVIGVCTPYMGVTGTDILLQLFGGNPENLYVTWFQEDGVAEARMDKQVESIFSVLMRRPRSPEQMAALAAESDGPPRMNPFMEPGAIREGMGETFCSEAEFRTYVDTYERTGFRGGINWYRNIDRNLGIVPTVGTQELDLPTLQICAEWDFALRPEMADGKEKVLHDYERHDIAKAGHWVQQEMPDELNGHLLDWLGRRFA